MTDAISINLEAPTWLAQAAFPIMKRQNYEWIVLTTSDRAIYKQYALSGLAAYAMGKMAQIGLMNVLAVEGKEQLLNLESFMVESTRSLTTHCTGTEHRLSVELQRLSPSSEFNR